MHQIIVQGVGYLALLFVLLSFQGRKRVQILLAMLTGVLLFVLHYSLLHAWTGALMNAIEASVVFVSFKKEKSTWANNKLWLYVFISLYVLAAALTVKNPVDVLPIIAQISGAIAVWQTNPRSIRFIMLIPRPLWFVYNLAVGSQAGAVAEVFMLSSVLAGIVRYDILKKKSKSEV